MSPEPFSSGSDISPIYDTSLCPPQSLLPPDCAHRLKIVRVKASSSPAAAPALGTPGGRKNQPSPGLKIDCHSGLCYVCPRPGGGSCPYYHEPQYPALSPPRLWCPKQVGKLNWTSPEIYTRHSHLRHPSPWPHPALPPLFPLCSTHSAILRKGFS